jgi:asparagine synthase (glutamine-hydrolysing)
MKGTILDSIPVMAGVKKEALPLFHSDQGFFFHAKNIDGKVHAKGSMSCFLGHKVNVTGRQEGIFAQWLWDGRTLSVKNDRYGFYPLYYYARNNELVLSPSINRILENGGDAALDYPAIAVFLRMGFFIGEDTPFKHIKALPPDAKFSWENGAAKVEGRYAEKRTVNIGQDAAIDQFIYLFRQAMQKRLPVDEDFAVPLSGGRDSRHILLELDHLGYLPKYCMTVRAHSADHDKDITPASLLCDKLGVEHRLLDLGDLHFEDGIRNIELANYCAYEHEWYLPLADSLQDAGVSTIYDGLGGDVLSTAVLYKTKLFPLSQARSYFQLGLEFFRFFNKPAEETFKLILDGDFYEQVSLDCALGHLTGELKKFTHLEDPVKAFYFWNRTRRSAALCPYTLVRGVPLVYSPFLDDQVFDFLMSVPDEVKDGNNFHTQTIKRAYPGCAHIPFQDENASFGRMAVSRRRYMKDFSNYYLNNFIKASSFLKREYFFPRTVKCLLDVGTRWWTDMPTMLYLMELSRL